MDGGQAQIIERGVLTAPDEAWGVAVRQAEVIGWLAAEPRVGFAAAAELGISRRQVYVLLGRWHAGEGVGQTCFPGAPAAAEGKAGCRRRARRSCERSSTRGI